MTLPALGQPISLSQIQTEFGGPASPIILSDYYVGGAYINNGVFAPNNIPVSGAIGLNSFAAASGTYNYTYLHTGNLQYNADNSWCVDYSSNHLRLSLGWFAPNTPSQLINLVPVNAGSFVIGQVYSITLAGNTSFTAIGAANNNVGTVFTATGVGSGTGITSKGSISLTSFMEVAQIKFDTPNVVYYGTGVNLVKWLPFFGSGGLWAQYLARNFSVGINTFSSFVAGSGYTTNGTYLVNLVGGSGSGASAYVTCSGGHVTDVSVCWPGTGYTVDNVLHTNDVFGDINGAGAGFTCTVGSVLGVSVPTAGWVLAAKWDGANTITIYTQWPNTYPADTGTSISMSNMVPSFGQVSGSVTYAANGHGGYFAPTPRLSYSFAFR